MEELELTYLAKTLPSDLEKAEKKEMLDIYIPASSDHPTLRIRKNGDKHEITKKQPIVDGDASRQLETTIKLTPAEFADLSQLPGKRVQKTRYLFQENNVNYEIDVFGGDLTGLVLVDVEFPTVEAKSAFSPPDWCLAEVTQETFLAGGMLCGKKYSDIENNLAKFGYQKVNLE
ncbi:MAG: hypothetical protein AAB364_01355 [Patescibacteria group bacterium]